VNDRENQYRKGEQTVWFAEIMTNDRFISILTDVHLAAIINDHRAETLRGCTLRFSRLAWACLAQQLHAVHKVKPRGGPRRSWRWSLPPRSAGSDNTYQVLSLYVESTFTSAKADRHRRSTQIEAIRLVYITYRPLVRILVSGCCDCSVSLWLA